MYDFLTEDDVDLNFKKVVVNQFNNVRCRELRNMPKVFLANFCRYTTEYLFIHYEHTQLHMQLSSVKDETSAHYLQRGQS